MSGEANREVDIIKELATKAAIAAREEARSASTAASAETGDPGIALLKQELMAAISSLQAGLVERDTEVRLMLLAALSGEHILFIGPPGTAKSELGRRLASLCKGGTFFERLLTRFTVPEELFGPLSMQALERDEYQRKTAGYLPEASVAFIDEIFKANSAILNTLLTILNERLFDNGTTRSTIPLTCLVGASNELPETDELDALYDRFLFRKQVSKVSRAARRHILAPTATQPGSYPGIDISDEKYRSIRAYAKTKVQLPDDVRQLIEGVWAFLEDACEPPVEVSDRRMMKATDMLKVAAFTSGRASVSRFDCLLLQHVLWKDPQQSCRIADYLCTELRANHQGLQSFDFSFNGMLGRALRLASDSMPSTQVQIQLLRDIKKLRKVLTGNLRDAYGTAQHGLNSATMQNIWISPDDSSPVLSEVSAHASAALNSIEKLLFEVLALEEAVRRGGELAFNIAKVLPARWDKFLRSSS